MPSSIISSFRAFEAAFKVPNDEKRVASLKAYFGNGGVISAARGASGRWPKLTYPSPRRVEEQIKELEKVRAELDRNARDWRAKLSDAKAYHAKHHLLKLSEPLYWKHKAKELSDKDYRKAAEKVGLPVHLVADKRWKPMVKMFLEDPEYRSNLVETVQTSIVYKGHKKVAKYADVVQHFRSGISEQKLKEAEGRIAAIEAQIAALVEIKKWASE